MTNLKWTGERVIPTMEDGNLIEHLHRYSIAKAIVQNKIVLDIASGEGYGTNILAENATFIYGVDIDNEAVEHAKKKYTKDNILYLQGKADQIPLENQTVDVAISFETIEHLENHEGMCLELKRVLKPNGVLLISSPERGIWPDNHFHIKELSNEDFKALMLKHFKNVLFYHQKTIMGSIIVPQHSTNSSFSYHQGNSQGVSHQFQLETPIFNLCIASDEKVDQLDISFFDGEVILKKNIAAPYQNSRLWRVMNSIKKLLRLN